MFVGVLVSHEWRRSRQVEVRAGVLEMDVDWRCSGLSDTKLAMLTKRA